MSWSIRGMRRRGQSREQEQEQEHGLFWDDERCRHILARICSKLIYPLSGSEQAPSLVPADCLYCASGKVAPYQKETVVLSKCLCGNSRTSYLFSVTCFSVLVNMTSLTRKIVGQTALMIGQGVLLSRKRSRLYWCNLLDFYYKRGDLAPANSLHHSNQSKISIDRVLNFQLSTNDTRAHHAVFKLCVCSGYPRCPWVGLDLPKTAAQPL
jgi:hypothetical protein